MEEWIEEWYLADSLVEEWYAWSQGYFPELGCPGLAPYCRFGKTSRQWDTTDEIAKEARERLVLMKVGVEIDALPFEDFTAIQSEMKKRQGAYVKNEKAGAAVWQPSVASPSYTRAIRVLSVRFSESGLFALD